jgi:L-asparaginase II
MANPIMVEATRGRYPESRYRGVAAVVDARGQIIRSWGDIYDPVFPRSSLKFIQALPLIESGAADAYHLTSQEIALACASHRAEEGQIKVLEAWLEKLGKDQRILECGIYAPPGVKKVYSIEHPSVLHNPCSGKHLGFLTTALYRNEPLKGYILREHAVQRRVEQALADMTDADVIAAPHGSDGCGIPAFALPLYNVALAMARLADPSHLHYPRQKAIQRILTAIAEHPEMIDGGDGFDARMIKATHGKIICKGGAGGFQVAIIPSLGYGLAVKMDDGYYPATEIAFLAILRSLGCLDEEIYERLGPRVPILTHKGKTVGFLQATNFTMAIPHKGHH